ncbi:MAG: metalloregulator ArsR/SmtB family transcription factor [Verrucomicrobiota bacterium]|nr:metalloregulator ArsR/SmtB family transcription factor [Verrucomicrobiota bacterium]
MSASNKSPDELARQLWAIGDIARLNLLQLLPETPDDCTQGNNVSTLAEKLGMSQPTVSHHLRILRQAGIVKNQKMCRDVYYWIDPVEAEAVLGDLRKVLLTSTVARVPGTIMLDGPGEG